MFPASFNEANHFLSRPEDMNEDQCDPLVVCLTEQAQGDGSLLPVVISCWKPTQEELDEIIRTKRVWLGIIGNTMPPAWLAGCSPFPPIERQS